MKVIEQICHYIATNSAMPRTMLSCILMCTTLNSMYAQEDNIVNDTLIHSNFNLSEVVVKGHKPAMKMINGGMSIDIKNSTLSEAGMAIDVLAELPRVNVSSSGSVSVIGKGSPLIFINGKKMSSKEELQLLTSKDIESIDIITAPGARYDAGCNSVIRIKTIKKLSDFMGGFVTSRIGYAKELCGNGSASVTYRKNGFDFTLYPYYSNSVTAEKNDFSNTFSMPDYTMETMQHMESFSRTQAFIPDASINYDFNKDHSVGMSFQWNKTLDYTSNAKSNYAIFRNAKEQGDVTQSSSSDLKKNRFRANIYYSGNIKKWHIQADGTYVNSRMQQGQHIQEESETLDNRTVNASSMQHSKLFAMRAEAVYAMNGSELSFGTELSHSNVDANYQNIEGYIRNSDNSIRESNYAGFITYETKLKNWSLVAGLRLENVKSEYYAFGKYDPEVSRNYTDLFPNISASWNKGGLGMQFSYGRKISRPSYSQLRNYQQYDSRYLYEGGNPSLCPTINNAIEIMGLWKWVSISMDYTYCKDKILLKNDIYENQEAVYAHYFNADQVQDLTAIMVMQPKFNWYQPQLTMAYYQQFFDAKKYGFISKLRRPEFGGKFTNKFIINKTFWLSLQCVLDNAYDRNTEERKAVAFMNFRAYKSFMKGMLYFNLYVNDIFNSNREKWAMRTAAVEINKSCNNYTRSITLQVTYRFNSMRSKYKGKGAGNSENDRL